MGKAKDPPPFSLEKPYEQWKLEIKAWRLTADAADQNKAALTIALSLPEKGCNSIRQRIFNSVNFFTPATATVEEKISESAWKDIIAFMDKEFQKDDIAQLYDKTDEFLHTLKKEEEAMKDYINRFDDALNQAEKAGMGTISQGFQMCLFLKNAGLEQKDFKFVVSAIDYSKKETLYPQAKDSMIKYFGSIGSKQAASGGANAHFDLETLWSGRGGWRGSGRGGFRGGFRGSRGGYGGGGYRDKNEENIGQRVESKMQGNIFGQDQPKTFRKLNPKKFGKILKCHNCQAITHLANECPESNITLIGESEDLELIM